MAQGVTARLFGEASKADCALHRPLGGAWRHVPARFISRGEEVITRAGRAPKLAEERAQRLGEANDAVATSFALLDADGAALNVDVAETNAHDLGDAHARRVEE